MWPRAFFARRFFAPRFFPQSQGLVGAIVTVLQIPVRERRPGSRRHRLI